MTSKRATPLKKLLEQHDAPAPFLSWALDYLRFYGYLKDVPTTGTVESAAKDFQVTAGIDADGVIGPQTLETMWLPRCGCRDDAFTESAKWRKTEMKWWVESYLEGLPGLSRLDQDDLQIEGFKEFEKYIDVRWTRANNRNEADVIVSTGQGRADGFDGPGGVLAWAMLPNGQDRQLTMKFDRSDPYIRQASSGQRGILYGNVDKHEKGHIHGMLHINGPTALLNPIYNPNVGSLLVPDRDALYALGYARAQPGNPGVPPTGQTRTKIHLEFEPGDVPNFKCIVTKGSALVDGSIDTVRVETQE